MDRFYEDRLVRLVLWNKGISQDPVSAEFHLTNKCNLNCKSCWQINNNEPCQELPPEKWIEIGEKISNMNIKEVYFGGGGEPMLRSDIILRILKILKKKNIYMKITTNGTLFDEEKVKKFVKLGFDEMQFSLDAADEKTGDYLRGEGSFNKLIKTLKLFKLWKKKYKKEKPVITFHSVLSNKNYDKFDKVIRLAEKLNICGCDLNLLVIHSEIGRKLDLNEKQKKEFLKLAIKYNKLAEKLDIGTNILDLAEENILAAPIRKTVIEDSKQEKLHSKKTFITSPCFEPWLRLTIHADGKVGSCCSIVDEEEFIENIMDKNLKEIWFGKKFNKLREYVIKKNLPKVCCTHPSRTLEKREIREFLIANTKKEKCSF
jgi:MoaA/NifB/PqqE/SkfB family radical SAM enzyme